MIGLLARSPIFMQMRDLGATPYSPAAAPTIGVYEEVAALPGAGGAARARRRRAPAAGEAERGPAICRLRLRRHARPCLRYSGGDSLFRAGGRLPGAQPSGCGVLRRAPGS